jgi:hypothetical protein
MRLVAFSPRLAGPAAELLGEPAIRIYHDNALSKERYTDHVGGRTWSAICPRSTDSSRRGQRYISGTLRLDQQVCGLVMSARAWPHAGRCRRTACGFPPTGLGVANGIKPGVPGSEAYGLQHGSRGPGAPSTRSQSNHKLDSAAHIKPEHATGAARPWPSVESRRCTPTVLAAGRRPLYVRGHRDTGTHGATR